MSKLQGAPDGGPGEGQLERTRNSFTPSGGAGGCLSRERANQPRHPPAPPELAPLEGILEEIPMHTGDLLTELLIQCGMTHVFGVPGAQTSALFDDIVCCDASYVTGWGMLFYQVGRAGKVILAPRGSAGLGFGIPAAIGAACARPRARIIALCGDHGVSYSLSELTTAVYYGLNIKVIVFNNQGSRWIDHYHRLTFQGTGEPFRWGNTDFSKVGQGFGCLGIRVEQPRDIAPALRQALTQNGPAVIDVVVSGEETPIAAYRRALDEKRMT